MVCPSTGKTYIVFVPDYNNVNDALEFMNRCYGGDYHKTLGYRQGDLLIAKIDGIANAATKSRWSNRMYNLNLIKET
jgi:PhoPQ-activated pathogenicity-related protein